MVKVIDGVCYDTLNATVDKKFTYGAPGDPCGYEETLYVTADGRFFVYTYGGVNSKYPHEDINPIPRDKVRDWIMSK